MRLDVLDDRLYLQGFRVFLDGIDVSDGCRWTDVERGEVGRYIRGPGRRFLIVDHAPVIEILRGKVELRPRPLRERLERLRRELRNKLDLQGLRAALEKSDLI